MKFILSASTDIGNTKSTNQDSLYAKIVGDGEAQMVFAVLCDGMGGLENGEVASASVIHAYKIWSEERLPVLYEQGISDEIIRKEWCDIAVRCNDRIMMYADKTASEMGTTATVLLLTEDRYYILNVGDTRAYEIGDTWRILTKDQTVVARDVEEGRITAVMAEHDERRSILLQCIGASESVWPDMFYGETRLNAVYMLCSDGFRHEVTGDEIYAYLRPDRMGNAGLMKQNELALIALNKQREERDNISVITIRTFA
ncbi:MAG: serine/threonine-protein phosphatase [Lachnospiraceae bacterium]|nr:serine/threonine-protein phosphatase [Lachnospiraceae bacterium]